jgi:hypothetical protein
LKKKQKKSENFLEICKVSLPLQSLLDNSIQTRGDSVAQLVEHLTFNQRVLGSNPSGITILQKKQILFEEITLKREIP